MKYMETWYSLNYVHMNHQGQFEKHTGWTITASSISKVSFHHCGFRNVLYHKEEISTVIKIKIIYLS